MVTLSFADCPVVELRRYTLRLGQRSRLLAVFERHLIEPQEDAGMSLGGTFTDEDDPDTFTWLRGFADHDARLRALEAFYGGPIWEQYRDRANATMVDSDDVLLLRPTQPPHGPSAAVPRGEVDDRPRTERAILMTCGLDADAGESWCASAGTRALEDVLGVRVAAWRTDPTPNPFLRLPVRDERAFVWLAVFPDAGTRDEAMTRLDASDTDELDRRTSWRRVFRLAPTARSAHPAVVPSIDAGHPPQATTR
ncbi:NIPSNAP family protein [Nonomuraea deserti]|nr:NIPSNAP family protein [Nonomuraea deserti]